jgi:hypothetical protein
MSYWIVGNRSGLSLLGEKLCMTQIWLYLYLYVILGGNLDESAYQELADLFCIWKEGSLQAVVPIACASSDVILRIKLFLNINFACNVYKRKFIHLSRMLCSI